MRFIRPSLILATTLRCGVLLLVVFCSNAMAESGWARRPSGTLAWLHAVYFVDQNHGWAVGSKGVLLKTGDGGLSWQQQRSPTEANLFDVQFLDANNGWLVCEKNEYELKGQEPRSYLMTTGDGGKTWIRVDVKDLDPASRLLRAVFRSSGRGWIFGEAGTVYATQDAGMSWKKLVLQTHYLLLGGTFIDDDRGWLVGAGATVMETSDGGETWHRSAIDAPGTRFTAASFVDNRKGWAVGAAGAVYSTSNGGRTWIQQASGVTADLLDVKFLNQLEGWAAGAEGTLIHTTDGGQHWTTVPSGTTHPLERLFFVDGNHGWAVGFGGTVVAYGEVAPVKAPTLQ